MHPCCKQILFCRAEKSPNSQSYPETPFSKNGVFAAINGEHSQFKKKVYGSMVRVEMELQ